MNTFVIFAAALAGFVFVWLITSLAVFMAGRMVVGGRATFAKSVVLILIGAVLLSIVYVAASTVLTPLIGWVAAFAAWLALIRAFFGTGWLSALFIAILASIIFMVLAAIMVAVLALIGLTIPQMPKPPLIAI